MPPSKATHCCFSFRPFPYANIYILRNSCYISYCLVSCLFHSITLCGNVSMTISENLRPMLSLMAVQNPVAWMHINLPKLLLILVGVVSSFSLL
jgi:hypothetical protein